MPAKKTPTNETENPPLTQAIPMGDFPESPVSASLKLYTPGGKDFMLTVRSGATLEESMSVLDVLLGTTKYGIEQYGLADMPPVIDPVPSQPAASPAPVASAPPVAEPATIPGDAPGITSFTFETEILAKSVEEGNVKWKVKGGMFRKYGVRIWPEVLEEAGFNADGLVEDAYSLAGYTAHYVESKPGTPLKVTKLVANE